MHLYSPLKTLSVFPLNDASGESKVIILMRTTKTNHGTF